MERPKQRVWLSLSLVASRQSRPAARVIHPFLFYPSLDPIAHKNCWLGNAPPSFCPCGPWPALHASAHAEPTFSKIPKRSHASTAAHYQPPSSFREVRRKKAFAEIATIPTCLCIASAQLVFRAQCSAKPNLNCIHRDTVSSLRASVIFWAATTLPLF